MAIEITVIISMVASSAVCVYVCNNCSQSFPIVKATVVAVYVDKDFATVLAIVQEIAAIIVFAKL